MKIYPYESPTGISHLVDKREYDGVVLLAHELATLRADDIAKLVEVTKERDELRNLLEKALSDNILKAHESESWGGVLNNVIIASQGILQEAVKRMESVSNHEIWTVYKDHPAVWAAEATEAVRARLIQAAKGEL